LSNWIYSLGLFKLSVKHKEVKVMIRNKIGVAILMRYITFFKDSSQFYCKENKHYIN